jgi:SAM-dependent methyltransferase
MNATELGADDWDQHWSDFSAVSEVAPATRYRYTLALRLLNIGARGQGVRLLDIGSGPGGFAEVFLTRFPQAQLLGLDSSATGVGHAAARVPSARFLQCDLMNPGAQPPFGATHAVCAEVLEHLDDPIAFLRNTMRFMAPGCRLVITVPGGKPNAFDRHIGHRRHFNARDLRQLIEAAGFEVELSTGAGFPFFNLYRLMTSWRGMKLVQDVSNADSFAVRAGMLVFGLLFHLNFSRWGWQTIALARYKPGAHLG